MRLAIEARRGKSRWLALFGLVVVAFSVLPVGSALATGPVGTASGFQDDDGNLIASDGTGIDWNSFATTSWTGTVPYQTSTKTFSGWKFKGLSDAQATTSDSGFAGGVKQDDACATLKNGKAPNKDDLKRIYVASQAINGHTYLELAWVRIPQNTTSASAHVAFEFNKGTDGLCAGSVLPKRVAGDMLIVYDFEGGSAAPVLTLRRWVTSGSCEIGSDTAPCWGTAANLTAGGFAEAKVNVGSTSTSDSISPSSPTSVTLGDSEFGEAGIDLTSAGVFSAGTCSSFGTVFGVSRSSGNSGQAAMEDIVGPSAFTLANCGTVIIRKETDPDGDTTTNFGFTTNVTTNPTSTTSPFSLKDGGSNTILNVGTGTGKTVTESDPSGSNYALQTIDCTASTVPSANISTSTSSRTVTFSIGGGETLDCTYTNKLQQGALKILKKSTKTGNPLVANAGAVFSYGTGLSVTDNGTGDSDSAVGSVCVSGVTPGSHSVSETTPPSGYGASSSGSQSVTVVAGTDCGSNLPGAGATATFTNPPLSDIQVNFRDGGSGETSATISCNNSTGTGSNTATSGWDTSRTVTGVAAPATVTCTITIDP